MTLKSELQAIEPTVISESVFAYNQKIESLAAINQGLLKQEVEDLILKYPALNELVNVATEIFLRSGNYSFDSVICAGAAASLVVGALVDIAEIQALPPLHKD